MVLFSKREININAERGKNEDDARKIHEELVKTYGNSIEIGAPRETLPMIKITNIMDDIVDKTEVEGILRNSNYWATDVVFKVSDHYDVTAANGKYTNIVLETDMIAQKTFLERGKIVYGLASCKVNEHTNLISCKSCQRLGHFARNCTFEMVCRRCGDSHKIEDCIVPERNAKCANCARANKNGRSFNVKHRTTDERCGVRKERIEALKALHLRKNI